MSQENLENLPQTENQRIADRIFFELQETRMKYGLPMSKYVFTHYLAWKAQDLLLASAEHPALEERAIRYSTASMEGDQEIYDLCLIESVRATAGLTIKSPVIAHIKGYMRAQAWRHQAEMFKVPSR